VLPAIDGLPAERFWFGREAQAVDDLPVLGGVDGLDGYAVAFGFSGHGLAISPAVGEAMADVVVGREPRHPIASLSPSRFAAGDDAAVAHAEAAAPMAQPDAG
jgi:sarcosine oxidase, subunit beta